MSGIRKAPGRDPSLDHRGGRRYLPEWWARGVAPTMIAPRAEIGPGQTGGAMSSRSPSSSKSLVAPMSNPVPQVGHSTRLRRQSRPQSPQSEHRWHSGLFHSVLADFMQVEQFQEPL